ncbi:MAG TPA: hypothetical protein VMM14_00070 [Acidimicrobiia bacterium]|nr:hypothetical protein [Acidimicrobiia bacterium]
MAEEVPDRGEDRTLVAEPGEVVGAVELDEGGQLDAPRGDVRRRRALPGRLSGG